MCSDNRLGSGPGRTASLELRILPGRLAVCRLDPGAPVPAWGLAGPFVSITRTPEELSIACLEGNVPAGVRCERGFRALGVAGPLDFAWTGILSSLLDPLARARISVFAVSTFDTDYLLVREGDLDRAVDALRAAEHRVAAD